VSAPSYDSYKESGVEGVGAIPTHWQMERLSHRVRTCRDMILPTELVGQEVYHYSIPVVQLTGDGRIEDGTEIDSAKLLIETEMLLVSKLNPRKATMCVARPRGVLTVASSEFVPLIPAKVDLGYLCFAAASAPFRTRLESRVESATKSHQRVTPSDILQTPWPFPPPAEQAAIAAFLDRETGKIDALVEAQTRLIELLKEKRQAVISHAVTKGLDPAAPMKDSGVEWLGQVPAHWSIRPLKYLVSLRSGGTPSKDNPDLWGGDVPWASAKDLKTETLTYTKDHLTELAVMSGAASLVQPGAVVVLVRGMMLARTFPVCEIGVPLAINQDLKALLPRNGLDGSFLAWALRGTAAETLNRLDEAGHGTKALRMEAWLSLPVPVPPMHEQRKISAELVEALAKLAGLTGQAQAAIALLQERRAALISAAVTGKIDVRGLAPKQAEAA
jgi:type I restriction enzyme S subunit